MPGAQSIRISRGPSFETEKPRSGSSNCIDEHPKSKSIPSTLFVENHFPEPSLRYCRNSDDNTWLHCSTLKPVAVESRTRRKVQIINGEVLIIDKQPCKSIEIIRSDVSTTFITCPADPKKTLGIKLPFLVMIMKNMKKYFTFEVLDDKNVRRRFRGSSYQSTTRSNSFICTVPIRIDEGYSLICWISRDGLMTLIMWRH
uniref:DUF667 domain-containing protein n=1 Tax=Glossina austeni TaxID=7395 RepID=A0A1A9VNQ6_GLOAU